jgi:hypothetical protein
MPLSSAQTVPGDTWHRAGYVVQRSTGICVSYTLLQSLDPFQRKPKVGSSSPNEEVCQHVQRWSPSNVDTARAGWLSRALLSGDSDSVSGLLFRTNRTNRAERRGKVENEVFCRSMLRADSRAYLRRNWADLEVTQQRIRRCQRAASCSTRCYYFLMPLLVLYIGRGRIGIKVSYC